MDFMGIHFNASVPSECFALLGSYIEKGQFIRVDIGSLPNKKGDPLFDSLTSPTNKVREITIKSTGIASGSKYLVSALQHENCKIELIDLTVTSDNLETLNDLYDIIAQGKTKVTSISVKIRIQHDYSLYRSTFFNMVTNTSTTLRKLYIHTHATLTRFFLDDLIKKKFNLLTHALFHPIYEGLNAEKDVNGYQKFLDRRNIILVLSSAREQSRIGVRSSAKRLPRDLIRYLTKFL